MDFAKEDDGRNSQRFFGAHTWRRTAFAGDYTGLEIQRTLIRRAEALDIPILDRVYITVLGEGRRSAEGPASGVPSRWRRLSVCRMLASQSMHRRHRHASEPRERKVKT